MEWISSLSEPPTLKSRIPRHKRSTPFEFVVIPDNLMPLIGVCTTQQMELITVHQDNFVTVPPPWRQSCKIIRKVETGDELVQHHTMPARYNTSTDENA